MYNGRKGIGFENPSYFCKENELRPSLYDERVIGLGYTPMFLTYLNEALEIEKFKRERENKIEFAYDYGNLNANKIIIDLEDEVVSLLEKEKENLKIIESLKLKGFESSENAIFESENQSENDCQGVEKGCDNLENSKVIAPGILYASYDVNDLFVFDDVGIRNSRVSKMPFRKNPRDSLYIVQICLWIIDSACLKHRTGNHALLTNFVEKFLGIVRFGYNDFTVIAGYGDVVIKSMTIKKVYYVEGLRHNLFSVGQFCDKSLEVAFQKYSCLVRTEDGVDLLTGDRSSNLYTIALNDVALNSSACLLEKASSSQSWLWHQHLSHLNFIIINNLVKNNLVRGLPKMKFEKYHLCSACEQGTIHRKHHKSKMAFASNKPLYLLYMDLCSLMHIGSINEKRYVLVVVDDYSRCYLLNDYDDVGKLKEKGDIGVFIGYSKESASFRIYNKRTRKIHENVIEHANVAEALKDADWVSAMQDELDQFARLKVWRLVP
ncbi:retrovirus-related pol polyprotein from transposon TNT 1-94 [Tanacetum coccineum]